MPILTEQLARCVRKSGREAEGTPLLRVQARKTGFGGSNPPFSASHKFWPSIEKAFIFCTSGLIPNKSCFFTVSCVLATVGHRSLYSTKTRI